MSHSERQAPTALITGGRRGIGRSICAEMATRGFDVVFTDLYRDADVEETCAIVAACGRKALFVQSNLNEVESHAGVIREAVRFKGSIECLVNNAGIGSPHRGDLLDVSPEAFDCVLGINLRGTFFMSQAVARHMSERRSDHPRSILTVSSVSAEMASPERAEYCLSKSALPMMTKLLALRLASSGIAVFEVRPGIIRTPMTEGVAQKYEARFKEGLVPAGRWGESAEVAKAVGALADGTFMFSTGSVLNVDGGLSIPAF